MAPPTRHLRPPRAALALLALWLAAAAAPAPAAAQSAIFGALEQPRGSAGCINNGGFAGCARGKALRTTNDLTISPDGRHLYASSNLDGIAILTRSTASGALTQRGGAAGCVAQLGAGGCTLAGALRSPVAVAISPEGNHVYAASFFFHAISAYSRDGSTGTLTPLPGTTGCVRESGANANCVDGRGFNAPTSIAVSPDGRNVYVAAATIGSIAVFVRDAATGVLTQVEGPDGCVSQGGADAGGGRDACASGRGLARAHAVTVSPDGRNVYAASFDSDGVAVFGRDPGSGALTQLGGEAGCINETGREGCANGRGLRDAEAIAVSGDGRHLYVVAFEGDAVSVLSRDRATGALTQRPGRAGCLSQGGAGGCSRARALAGPSSVAVSADGRNVYVAASGSDAVTAFSRDRGTGALLPLPGPTACMSDFGVGGCLPGRSLDFPIATVVSPDGADVYAAAPESKGIAVFNRRRGDFVSFRGGAVRFRGGSGGVAISCRVARGDRCRGELLLRAALGGRLVVLARGRIDLPGGGRAVVRLGLGARGRRLLAERRRLRGDVLARVRNAVGRRSEVRRPALTVGD